MSEIVVRKASTNDVPDMVKLSYDKRRTYEKAQPQFWRYAGSKAEEIQKKWFEELILQDDYIVLIAEIEYNIVGFVIGRIIKSPEVYDPGGLTLMIDDFCVEVPIKWQSVGYKLIDELKQLAKIKNIVQILVVCGTHDKSKKNFLKNINLICTSEWYVGKIL